MAGDPTNVLTVDDTDNGSVETTRKAWREAQRRYRARHPDKMRAHIERMSARGRAMRRLAREHSERFAELLAEESAL